MTDDKKTNAAPADTRDKPSESAEPSTRTWVDDMKQELEDYIEDQGIYIRQ